MRLAPDQLPPVRDNLELTGLISLFALTAWAAVFAIASIAFGIMALVVRRRHPERALLGTAFVPHTLASLLSFASVAGAALVGLWLLPVATRSFLDEQVWLLVLIPLAFWWSGFALLRARGRATQTRSSMTDA